GIGDEDQVSIIVMQRHYKPKFKQLLEVAKEKYKQLPTKSEEIVVNKDWEAPESMSIFSDYAEIKKSDKSIIKSEDEKKLFVKKNKIGKIELSKPERIFIEGLEKTDDELQWWFKNSYGESKYFSIAYKKANGHYYSFYPDFILKTKKETLIVEIKDDNGFKTAENALKLRASQDYLAKYKHKEKLRFYILSPNDYDNFFQQLQSQDLDKFKSLFEAGLLRYIKSQQVIINNKDKNEITTKEKEWLHEVEKELEKTIDEHKDTKLKNELLQMQLNDAQENIKVLSKSLSQIKPEKEKREKIKIQTPFNICVLGEVSDEVLIIQELQKYFTKNGVGTNNWDIKFFNNIKLQSSDVLRSLIKGQSKFHLVITGQIHHHSGKGNKKANIISELKSPKYIPSVVGSEPQDLLTPDKTLQAIESFFQH
ncbi:MAG: hypothetical protein KAJ18_12245, partial [Candidatus Omnitrophica bacterium]|nr:hypothetical protein [Candidatus Omnitrophota bacterium]